MTESAQVVDALRKLDVANDQHWTTDGQARLDTVKALTDDPTISRETVDNAAPGFRRTNAADYKTPAEQEAPPAPPVTDGPTADTPPAVPPAPPVGTDSSATEGAIVAGDTAPNTAGPSVVHTGQLPVAPGPEALRGTDNDTLRANASEPGTHNLNAEGGPSDGPSVSDAVQGTGNSGLGLTGGNYTGADQMPPSIAQGATMRGSNQLATPESDARDALATAGIGTVATLSVGDTTVSQGAGTPAGDQIGRGAVDAGGDASEAQLPALDDGSASGSDEIEDMEAELEAVNDRCNDLRGAVDKVNAELYKQSMQASVLRARIEAARGKTGHAEAVQNYFASQDQIANDRAAKRKQIEESGVDLKGLLKSLADPIDQKG